MMKHHKNLDFGTKVQSFFCRLNQIVIFFKQRRVYINDGIVSDIAISGQTGKHTRLEVIPTNSYKYKRKKS